MLMLQYNLRACGSHDTAGLGKMKFAGKKVDGVQERSVLLLANFFCVVYSGE